MRKLIVRYFALSRLTIIFGKAFSYGTGAIPMLSTFFIMSIGEVFYKPVIFLGLFLFFVFGFIIFGYFKMNPLTAKDYDSLSLFQKYNFLQLKGYENSESYKSVDEKIKAIYDKNFYNIIDFLVSCFFFFGSIALFVFFYG